MSMKRWVLMTSAGGMMAVAAALFAAPPPAPRTVTIPQDGSWIPAPSTTSARAASGAAAPDADATFRFQSEQPHAKDAPPPLDPAAVGRMPEDSGRDARVQQACWSNPHQPKCH